MSQLGKAQLNGLRVSDAIESYKKANDPSNFKEVIEIASHAGKDDELISYLLMARKTLREPDVDGQLLLSYAATDKLYDLKDFLNSPMLLTSRLLVTNSILKSIMKLLKLFTPVFPIGLNSHLLWFS